MKDKVIILKVGYSYFAFQNAKGRAGILLDLFQNALPVRPSYTDRETYRVEDPKRPTVSVELVDGSLVLAPKDKEGDESEETIALLKLAGGVRLLKGGGS